MSFLKYFMFPAARRRAERRERRHAFRNAENAIAEVKARQATLDKESKKHWNAAREALKAGQKAAANRELTSYRAAQTMVIKLEQKRWVFEQYLTKMQMAESDTAFSEALGAINKIVRIDPEKVADVFDEANDLLGEQVDSERFWNSLYEKEMEGATGGLEDHIPSMEDLASQLEQEAAAEVGGAAAPKAADAEINARISDGQQRVKDILAGK